MPAIAENMKLNFKNIKTSFKQNKALMLVTLKFQVFALISIAFLLIETIKSQACIGETSLQGSAPLGLDEVQEYGGVLDQVNARIKSIFYCL